MGPVGFYGHQLFDHKPSPLNNFNHGVELGRSFIRPEYQKQLGWLSLLWRGIGKIRV